MKYVDKDVVRYEELNELIKGLTKERDEIKARFLAEGSGESENYLVALKDNYRETVAGKAEFDRVMGPDFLRSKGLLKVSAFNTVTIALKTSRKVG